MFTWSSLNVCLFLVYLCSKGQKLFVNRKHRLMTLRFVVFYQVSRGARDRTKQLHCLSPLDIVQGD
jgi:hypothetical protein